MTKKFFVLVTILVIGSLLSGCGKLQVSYVDEDGGVSAPVVIDLAKACDSDIVDCGDFAANEAPAEEATEIIVDFGSPWGSYKAVMDTNRDAMVLGWWTDNQMGDGTKDLADLKREGGSFSFEMPADGWINQSGGVLVVDGEIWDLGNYAERNPLDNSKMIRAGQKVQCTFQKANDSAGIFLVFNK